MTQRRWLALCGVVSPILIALAFFVVDPGSSDGSQSAAKVMSTYRGDKSAGVAAAYMVVIAAVLLVMFAARLREVLHAGEISGGGAFSGRVAHRRAALQRCRIRPRRRLDRHPAQRDRPRDERVGARPFAAGLSLDPPRCRG
jgi:hypothetical protein